MRRKTRDTAALTATHYALTETYGYALCTGLRAAC
jgi:hypothetical protein